jgi:hypothetical protein
MKNFIKENWFKAGILLLVLIMACSISYYYLIFTPQQDKALLQQQISTQNEAQVVQQAQQQEAQTDAAAKEQQFETCIKNAHQVFVDDGTAECQQMGYTQTQINDLQCILPDSQALITEQSNAQALCATLYK